MHLRSFAILSTILALGTTCSAQWDPANGDWSKAADADLRVMTWNVQDALCRTNSKVEFRNDWTAIAMIVASMQPDVLLLQECGDNSGNGTGGGVDSVSNLTTVMELFMHGGADPFNGGTVGAYVQKYAPGYDLPYIFVSSSTDNFNRNIILSRHPFVDVNGDGVSIVSDFLIFSDQYAPGGTGGIRGFAMAEIDLPDSIYLGDVAVGNSHLKSGSSTSDKNQRRAAAQNIAYYIEYGFNGAGTGSPNSTGKLRSPVPANVLSGETPFIWGGDWNEDELSNGQKGPAEWMTRAQLTGGSDGTDRDQSDAVYDNAVDLFTGNRSTQSSSKLDYLAHPDSVVSIRNQWIFHSGNLPSGAIPAELSTFIGGAALATSWASDHRPVIVDYIMAPAANDPPGPFSLVTPIDGAQNLIVEPTLIWTASADADAYRVQIWDDPGMTNIIHNVTGLTSLTYDVPAGVLDRCTEYTWRVRATNDSGSQNSTPNGSLFGTINPDFNDDGFVNTSDFIAFLNAYNAGLPSADFNNDTFINTGDFIAFLNAYNVGC